MLSTENPPPPLDLPCNNNCEIPQLKNYSISSDEDERDSSCKNNHNQVEVDLLNKSSFDDNHNNPLPKFSIRDYVFDTRGKDIENNWPFSQENLQLCLKYGVKDVLPPFQSLDSVRNPTTEKLVSDVKLSESDNRSVDEKLASNVQNIDSCRSEEDKDHPSCSDLNSVPVAEDSQRTQLKKVVKSNNQNSVKKCRLVLKLNNISERKPNENSSANPSAASETTMASKVCPVCKTFSSSSNTTLNAHIDQCLSSGGPTVKWTENPKVSIKHRIKPRKTRLMVDIYETALQCTLEDLDRRNGTNWASSNSGSPAQGLKACAEEKNKAYSSVDVGKSNEKDAVYIDSKSPKIRSLSKLSDQPSSSFSKYECGGPSKIVAKDKCCEFVESKKKKCLVRKHELLKHPIYGQRSCSPSTDNLPKSPTYGPKIFSPRPDHSPEPKVNNGQQKQCEGYLTPPHTSFDRMKSDDLGMIKQWVGSKRTGPKKKKNNLQHENQHPDKTVKCSRENGESPLSPTQSHRRKENVLCDSSLISQDCHVKKSQLARKDPPSVAQNQDSSRSNKKMRINVDPAVNTDSIISQPRGFPSQDKEKTSSGHAISSGSKKFSSLRKKLLSVRRTSAPESRKSLGRKRLDFKKPRLSYASGSDDEVEVSQTKRATGKPSINGTTVLKLRKKRIKSANAAKEDVGLKDSKETSPEPDSDDAGRNVSSFLRENVIIDTNNEFVCEPTYKIADEGEEAFDKSLDSTTFHEFVCSENVVEDLVAPNGRAVAEMEADNEGKINYFADVDPIPIPGPPGSFLPSPGRMCSEDLQGNSSLTTCRVQSSEDEHEAIVDRMMGSSDSPISARSYSGPVVNFSSKSHVQHAIEGGPINTERELIHLDESRGNLMCCCSRKDGAFLQSGPSMCNQDSQLLRRRTMTPLSVPARDKTHSSNYSGYWKEQTEEPGKNGANCETKLRACIDCEFPSPSTPNNPVLRLMGKNLMVANKDENQVSPQTRPAYFSGTAMEHPISPRFCADNSQSGAHSFRRNLPRGHYSMYENSQTSMPAQHFDFVRSNPANFRPLSHDQLSSGHHHPSTHMLSSKSFGGGTFITSSPNTRTYDSRGNNNKYKEIIVIDDSPENRATNKGKQYTEGEGSYVTMTSSSPSMASRYEYDPRAANHHHHHHNHHPFYGYPVYNGGPPPMERNGNVQVAVPKGMMNNNANLGQWNYCSSPPEGSRLLHPNSSLQASASTANLRSSLSYFSPSFL